MLKSEGRELRLLLLLLLLAVPPVVEPEDDVEVDEEVEEARLLAESLAALEEFYCFYRVVTDGFNI
jgi:hypothetical protein